MDIPKHATMIEIMQIGQLSEPTVPYNFGLAVNPDDIKNLKNPYLYCPNCVIELIPDKKKLSGCINWLVCTECGFRTRPENQSVASSISVNFSLKIKQDNIDQVDKKQPYEEENYNCAGCGANTIMGYCTNGCDD